jgi:hypothetical protein
MYFMTSLLEPGIVVSIWTMWWSERPECGWLKPRPEAKGGRVMGMRSTWSPLMGVRLFGRRVKLGMG